MNFKKFCIRFVSFVLILIFFFLSLYYLDFSQLWIRMIDFFIHYPELLIFMTICYFISFLMRAIAWKKYLNDTVKLRHCLQGVLSSLFINHILPVKLGDFFRIGLLTRKEKNLTLNEATHSVVIMRLLDMLTLVTFTFIGLVLNSKEIILKVPIWLFLVLFIIVILFIPMMRKRFPTFYEKHIVLLKQGIFSSKIFIILPLIVMSWILEGSVLWGVMRAFEKEFSIWNSVWVNSITVGGQVFQITPGGITTYESIMTITLGIMGMKMSDAYEIAFISHGYKFLFSYVIGCILLLLSPKTNWKEMKEFLSSKGG